MTFIPLKNLIPHALRRNKIAAQVEATLVLKEFNKIAKTVWGEQVMTDFKPLYVKDKILTIAVISAALATEIRLNKNNIINFINESFNQLVIKDIRILM